MLIKAICDNHALLVDGNVQIIGSVKDKKRYTGGGCILPTEIVLHYGTPFKDRFYFENDELVYMSVTMETPEYLTKTYSECAREKVTPSQFVDTIKQVYVFKSLGF